MTDKPDKHWIKFPGPGQYRGMGIWSAVEDTNAEETGVSDKDRMALWEEYNKTGYLPTHVGPEPPDDNDNAEEQGHDADDEPPRVQ